MYAVVMQVFSPTETGYVYDLIAAFWLRGGLITTIPAANETGINEIAVSTLIIENYWF
jgi:hypothetical protein